MKKVLISAIVCIIVVSFNTPLVAGERAINLFANVGAAASDFEGIFVDVGAELQLTDCIYGQLSCDYYFENDNEYMDLSLSGINLFAVYKFRSSGSLKFFVKAGVHYSTQKFEYKSDYLSKISDSLSLDSFTKSDFGFAGGAGLEYALNKKLALVAGGSIKLLSFKSDNIHVSDANLSWFKFYGGINYRIN